MEVERRELLWEWKNRCRSVFFFSGLGLLDLGFENAGFNIVFVNEYNKRFLQAYQYARKNSGHLPVYGYSDRDIREYLSDDVWHHSFPTYDEREKS